jgi:hypothetical protein
MQIRVGEVQQAVTSNGARIGQHCEERQYGCDAAHRGQSHQGGNE